METGILAPGSQSTSASKTIHNSSPEESSSRHDHRLASSESVRDDNGSLEMWGWSGALDGWNNNQLRLLRESWRPSTRKVYNIAWERWISWCRSYKINHIKPKASEFARFLSDLHLIFKLSYSSVLLHKSVVSTLCDPNLSGQLSSHVLVKHILKSIALRKPISHMKDPIWNIDVLVSYLKSYSVDETNVFQVQRHTAALLLLCSGRRIHDLTLLTVDSANYIFDDNSVVFWPSFGSKTDSITYRQSGWKLLANKENKKLDPVFWIKLTKSLLEDRRRLAKSFNLFINIRGEPRPASRTLIGGWIKSLFKNAGVSATPGSIRSAVASKNWFDNRTVDEILAKGNWQSKSTFTKYYLRLIKSNHNTESVTQLFDPII